MRIILLASTYAPRIGGVERVAGELAGEFQRLGHEVRVITNRYPRHLPAVELRDGIPVRRLHFLLPRLRYLRQGRLALFLAATILAPATFVRLCAIFLHAKPDIVNVHYLGAPAPFVLAARWLMPFRLVVSFHGADVQIEPRRSWFDRWLFRLALRKADRVTFCSNALREEAAAVGPLTDAVSVVIHNGANTALLAAAAPEQRARRYLFAAGRLERQKGFDLLIAAFARAAGDRPDVDLVIAGEGPERAPLEATAVEHAVAQRVVFMGPCPAERVAALMKGSVRTVIPSRREPFGLVGMEARVAGVPVIASTVGGLPEALAGADVVWCTPGSLPELAEAIGDALNDGDGKGAPPRNGSGGSLMTPSGGPPENISWRGKAQEYLQVYLG
ncbi:MAG TPA: glycosyltransferase [Bacteroidota bacterium]